MVNEVRISEMLSNVEMNVLPLFDKLHSKVHCAPDMTYKLTTTAIGSQWRRHPKIIN